MKTTWAYILMIIGITFIVLAILAHLNYTNNYGSSWASSSTQWILVVIAIIFILSGFILWSIVKKPKTKKT